MLQTGLGVYGMLRPSRQTRQSNCPQGQAQPPSRATRSTQGKGEKKKEQSDEIYRRQRAGTLSQNPPIPLFPSSRPPLYGKLLERAAPNRREQVYGEGEPAGRSASPSQVSSSALSPLPAPLFHPSCSVFSSRTRAVVFSCLCWHGHNLTLESPKPRILARGPSELGAPTPS
jgi:hypothetical protein